jgi:hypothetical protein
MKSSTAADDLKQLQIYGQNCLKERLIGLLGVAHSRVIPFMESRAAATGC